MWGLSISGLTEKNFLYLLFILVLYFAIKHLFVVYRIFLVSDGWSTLGPDYAQIGIRYRLDRSRNNDCKRTKIKKHGFLW